MGTGMKRARTCGAWVLLALLFLAGCRTTPVSWTVNGPGPWTGLDVTISLPPGIWLGRLNEGERSSVFFTSQDDTARFALFRRPSASNVPLWVMLHTLFLEFPEKRSVGQWSTATPAGAPVCGIAFLVTTGSREAAAAACALRRGDQVYAIAAWGPPHAAEQVRVFAESLATSMTFADGDSLSSGSR